MAKALATKAQGRYWKLWWTLLCQASTPKGQNHGEVQRTRLGSGRGWLVLAAI